MLLLFFLLDRCCTFRVGLFSTYLKSSHGVSYPFNFNFVFCHQMTGFMYTTGKRRLRNGNGRYAVIGMLNEIRHSTAFIF